MMNSRSTQDQPTTISCRQQTSSVEMERDKDQNQSIPVDPIEKQAFGQHMDPMKRLNQIVRQLLCGFIGPLSSSSSVKKQQPFDSLDDNNNYSIQPGCSSMVDNQADNHLQNPIKATRNLVADSAAQYKNQSTLEKQWNVNCCSSLRSRQQLLIEDASSLDHRSSMSGDSAPSHLIKMIKEKNRDESSNPKQPQQQLQRSQGRDMLILLGDPRCPSESAATTSNQSITCIENKPKIRGSCSTQVSEPVLSSGRLINNKPSSKSIDEKSVDLMRDMIEILDHRAILLEQEQSLQESLDSDNCRTRSNVENNEDPFYLEENWSSFVQLDSSSCESNSDTADSCTEQQARELVLRQRANQKVQQDAIWELLSTEVFYIKRLKVVIYLFLNTLTILQQRSILLEIDSDQISSNIGEVYQANCTFWLDHLRPMLIKARSNSSPLDPSLMEKAFAQIRNIFNPYYRYCLEHNNCLKYIKEQNKVNEYFKVYVAWCESQKACERLRLMDLLAKPMQRLTRYSLLLKAISRKTDNHEHFVSLEQMIAHVNKFVLTVDLELSRKIELERLLNIVNCIDSYDACNDVYSDEIDRLLRVYSQFDIMAPLFNCPFNCHRQLLFDSSQHFIAHGANFGQLKFKDAQAGGKHDIILLIFTDHLFICKQAGNKWYHQNSSHYHKQQQQLGNGQSSADQSPSRSSAAIAYFSNRSGHQRPRTISSEPAHVISPNAHLTGQQQQQTLCATSQVRARTGSRSTTLHNSLMGHSNQSTANISPRAYSLILGHSTNSNHTTASFRKQNGVKSEELEEEDGLRPHAVMATTAREQTLPGAAVSTSQLLTAEYPKAPVSHSSTSSLVGHAAREFFVRSNASSRSGDNQADSQSGQLTPGMTHLRVIRPPYPIDRLVMHELKDGQSVLFCQLNDSQTIANSFILIIQVNSNEPSNRLSDQQHLKGSHNYPSTAQDISGRTIELADSSLQSESKRRVSPASQLINLVRQAQVRYQLAANFHDVPLSIVGGPICEQGTSTFDSVELEAAERTKRPNRKLQPKNKQAAKSRFTNWSSFRGNSRKGSKKLTDNSRQHSGDTTSYIDTMSFEKRASSEKHLLEVGDSRASDGSQSSEQFNAQSGPLIRSIIDQHQMMMINHSRHKELCAYNFIYPLLDNNYLNILPMAVSLSRSAVFDGRGENVPTNGSSLVGTRTGSQSSLFAESDRPTDGGDMVSSNSPGSRVHRPLLRTCNNEQQLLSPNRCSQSLREYKILEAKQRNKQEPMKSRRSSRKHFLRSARVPSNNFELSSDDEISPISVQNSANSSATSLSSTLMSAREPLSDLSAPEVFPNRNYRHKQPPTDHLSWEQDLVQTSIYRSSESNSLIESQSQVSAGSSRKNLSQLRRQNVMSSISVDHRSKLEQLRRLDGIITSPSAKINHLPRLNRLESLVDSNCSNNQANGAIFTALDGIRPSPDANQPSPLYAMLAKTGDIQSLHKNTELLTEPKYSAGIGPSGDKAISFELGNLRSRNLSRSSVIGKRFCSTLEGEAEVRQLSQIGLKSPISVTLTLPTNDDGISTDVKLDKARNYVGCSRSRGESFGRELGLRHLTDPVYLDLPQYQQTINNLQSVTSLHDQSPPIKSSDGSTDISETATMVDTLCNQGRGTVKAQLHGVNQSQSIIVKSLMHELDDGLAAIGIKQKAGPSEQAVSASEQQVDPPTTLNSARKMHSASNWTPPECWNYCNIKRTSTSCKISRASRSDRVTHSRKNGNTKNSYATSSVAKPRDQCRTKQFIKQCQTFMSFKRSHKRKDLRDSSFNRTRKYSTGTKCVINRSCCDETNFPSIVSVHTKSCSRTYSARANNDRHNKSFDDGAATLIYIDCLNKLIQNLNVLKKVNNSLTS